MKTLKIISLVIAVAICQSLFASCSSDEGGKTDSGSSEKVFIAGYINSNQVNDQRDLSYVAHVDRIYFFGIAPDDNGEFTVSDHYLWALDKIRSLTKKNQDFLMVIGTGGSAARMHLMGDDPVKRAAFVKKAVSFAKEHGFNGIDIDWETNWRVTPYKYVDTDNLKALIRELRAEMPKDWILTSAMSGANHDAIQTKEIIDMLDEVNIMIYDIMTADGQHVPYSLMVERLKLYDNQNVPHNKSLIGVPFYGRNTNKESMPYRNIIDNLPTGDISTSIWNGYSFNSISILKEKLEYARKNRYKGIMIWELNQDVPYSDSRSLLRALNQE